MAAPKTAGDSGWLLLTATGLPAAAAAAVMAHPLPAQKQKKEQYHSSSCFVSSSTSSNGWAGSSKALVVLQRYCYFCSRPSSAASGSSSCCTWLAGHVTGRQPDSSATACGKVAVDRLLAGPAPPDRAPDKDVQTFLPMHSCRPAVILLTLFRAPFCCLLAVQV
jgi:hypothetical protein